ncbi:MAG: F0F1 ATP synthase subunit B [Xanthomonadaceae bacterium]|jgi:F-type H+-transporting ATPase subunit b|nr:F0F1 ATP synthase subunit B [Xanthomonadaceae bacterium]
MDINATFIGQALAFAILIWFSYKFVWPPLTNAIDERQKKIADGLAAAERSKKDLAQAEDKVNEVLKEARSKANEIIDQAHQRGNQIIEQAKNEAVAEANRQKALAQTEIDLAANRAREQLRGQFAALAISGAERLIKREIDPAAHKALLDEFAAEL